MTALPVAAIDWAKELGLSWADLLLVVLAAVGIYLAVLVLTRVNGPRPIASFSTFDVVVGVAMGSLVGRVVLVRTSLLAGVVGLAVLFVLQMTVRRLRNDDGAAFVEPAARLLVWQGDPLPEGLRRAGLSRWDLHAQLRGQGVGDMGQVQAAVFERDGELTVIHADTPLDPHMLVDVSGLPDAVAAAARESASRDTTSAVGS